MKLNYELSKLALHDIEKIWYYSIENCSKNQANKYYKDIFREIILICENPEIGKRINDIKPNHRMKSVKSHFIVYKVLKDIISLTEYCIKGWTLKTC